MFSKRLFFKSKALAKLYTNKSVNVLRPSSVRWFTSNVKGMDEHSETVIEDHNFYSPVKEIKIGQGTLTVFDNTKVGDEHYIAPYEIKETVLKNSIGIVVTFMLELTMMPMYYIPTTLFATNMFYRVCLYMAKAVDQVVLLS